MKIAQIAPLEEAVPPRLYGGTERIVAYLTDALVELGHEVTLFASGDSRTAGKLIPMCPQALRLDPAVKDPIAPLLTMVAEVARRSGDFDIIHSHIDHLGFSVLRQLHTPSITTLHGRLDLTELAPLYEVYGEMKVVSISEAQRQPLPHANYVSTILHGLPQNLLHRGRGCGGYAAFLGRISPEKGPDAAMRIARRAGITLKMAAKVGKADLAYFHDTVAPLIEDTGADFVGEIRQYEKQQFLGDAAALLFPIAWPEPFGLVMIEAMACGTPVIAYDNGSVREILRDGVTGFIVRNEDEAVEALRRAGTLDRHAIRAEFEHRFTSRQMALNYSHLYASICPVDHRAAIAAMAGEPRAPLLDSILGGFSPSAA